MSGSTLGKTCPQCGTRNPVKQAYCVSDGYDLTRVGVTPEADSPALEAQGPPSGQTGPELIAARPEARATERIEGADSALILESIDSPGVYLTIAPGQVVGRGTQADVMVGDVPGLARISRRHAAFHKRGQQWFVQHIGSTNWVVVDGERYSGDEHVAIFDGSTVALGTSAFIVTLRGE